MSMFFPAGPTNGVILIYHRWDNYIDRVVGQIINAWEPVREHEYPLSKALDEAVKRGGAFGFAYPPSFAPSGTIIGVKTMGWPGVRGVLDSMQPIKAGPVTRLINKYAATTGMTPEILWKYTKGLTGVGMSIGINGLHNFYFYYTPLGSAEAPAMQVYLSERAIGIPMARYFHMNEPPSERLQHYINVSIGPDIGEDIPQERINYHLYHVVKIGATITPPHETILQDGQMVEIVATPLKGRFLTEFTVQSVDVLAESLIYPKDQAVLGLPSGANGEATRLYGPVHEDVYVTAIAAGIDVTYEITAGVPITIQCTTTDCYIEGINWELGATDLPSTVTKSIDENGLITLSISENVYEGIPGGLAYLDFTYTGYSQAITRRLRLTIKPVPAFGTVWTSKALLSQQVKDIFRASDGTCYITGDTMIWRTTDFITFTEHTFDSAITNTFRNCMEASNGRIVVCDARRVWVKAAGSDQFVSTAMTADINTAGSGTAGKPILASPNSNEVHLVSLNYTSYTSVKHLNIDTGATVGIYGIGSGGLYMFPGVIADNGTRILAIGGVSGAHKVWIYRTNGTYAVVVNGGGSGNHTPAVWREETGRIWVRGLAPSGKQFTQYSDDNGETFSAQVDGGLAIGVPGPGLALKRNYSIVSYTNDVYRTPDAFATCPLAQANLGGTTIQCFFRLANRKLLAGTNGTTTNLYISEV